MAVDASALVLVQPNDTIDSIAAKVRGAGTPSVQLLVPDHTAALQARGDFARLRKELERDRISLLVISSDERTLSAAQLNQIDTMGVQGARVTIPAADAPGDQANPYATRTLRPEDRPQRADPPISSQDAAFLEALDSVPAQNPYANLDDADLYAALDDLSVTIQQSEPPPRAPRSADEDFAAALDELSDIGLDDPAPRRPPPGGGREPERRAEEPRRRVRPEDIEIGPADRPRQREGRRPSAGGRATETGRAGAGARRGTTTSGRMLDPEEAAAYAPRGRAIPRLLPLIVVAVLLVLLALLWLWYYNSRATIQIAPPPAAVRTQPFTDETIALSQDQSPATVQALPVEADAEYTVQGQVTSETLTPVSRAAGTITIYNRVTQPIDLPEGTEFIAQNPQGQEVRLALDVPATVPPAVTSTSVTGTSTTNGSIIVAVTARSPGAASNVGENAITQLALPGQEPQSVTGDSTFIVQHAAIGGGADQPQRVVTEAEVERVLQDALNGLLDTGFERLRGQIDESRLGIDGETVIPNQVTLGDPANYQMEVSPGVGQPVPSDNPTFSLTVRTRFKGLATVPDKPVVKQLQAVVPEHLEQKLQGQLPCSRSEVGFPVKQFRWDGSKLTIDAEIVCTPSGQLTPDIESKVRAAVRGQPYEAAEAGLQKLREQGQIGDFRLPAQASFPSQDFLLQVEQTAIVSATPAPDAPEPTGQPGATP